MKMDIIESDLNELYKQVKALTLRMQNIERLLTKEEDE
jgi:hypothetical protein